MVTLVKLTVVSKSGEEASFLQESAYLSSYSLHSVEKQPYLMSISSYQLSVKRILLLMRDQISDSYKALRDCYIG